MKKYIKIAVYTVVIGILGAGIYATYIYFMPHRDIQSTEVFITVEASVLVNEYLGRYTHKIAIGNHRILNIDKEKREVTFSLKDYRKGGQRTTMTLRSKEFIRRFQLHILPKGFTRIRHYGFLSSSWKKERLPLLQLQLADKNLIHTESFVIQEKSVHRICPSCKKGTLITLLTFDSRGPPKECQQIVKRKLLKFSM